VPWQQVAGFRDVLIHDYLKVNLNRVWGVIEQNLPQLKATVEAILQELRELSGDSIERVALVSGNSA
jgi:uncharacterized protein with HEPN domain